MNDVELRARLERLERSTNRLRALVAGLTIAVISLALIVMLQPVPAEAQGRVVAARGFQLVNDDGNLVGEWILNERGEPHLFMWLGDSSVSLAVNAPASGESTPRTFFAMDGRDAGRVQISTPGTSSSWPSMIIYTQLSPGGPYWPKWSAPPGSAPGT